MSNIATAHSLQLIAYLTRRHNLFWLPLRKLEGSKEQAGRGRHPNVVVCSCPGKLGPGPGTNCPVHCLVEHVLDWAICSQLISDDSSSKEHICVVDGISNISQVGLTAASVFTERRGESHMHHTREKRNTLSAGSPSKVPYSPSSRLRTASKASPVSL